MNFVTWYKKHKDQWWMLPLILPLTVYPVAEYLSSYTTTSDTSICNFYINLALPIALTMIYGLKALPGIIIMSFVRIVPERGFISALFSILHYLTSTGVSCLFYYLRTGKRGRVSFGIHSLTKKRLFWLVFVCTTLFTVYYNAIVYLGLFGSLYTLKYINPFTITSLINYQGIVFGTMVSLPIMYLLIRTVRNPHYFIRYLKKIRSQVADDLHLPELLCMSGAIIVITALLISPFAKDNVVLHSIYTLTLLFPVMIWGALRLGNAAMTVIWFCILTLLLNKIDNFIPQDNNFYLHLAVASACFASFSFTITLMAMSVGRLRKLHLKFRELTNADQMVHLPNLLALSGDLKRYSPSTLVQLYMPELELHGRHYGYLVVIEYKQHLASSLETLLENNECIYAGSGNDLLLRLNADCSAARLNALFQHVQAFRFIRNGLCIYPQTGFSYCLQQSRVENLPLLIATLRAQAEISLTLHKPVDLALYNPGEVQQQVQSKIEMMNLLQQALTEDRFVLMVQPIQGRSGERYHEILLRMLGHHDELIFPDTFLPLADEFDMSSRIDMWVLRNTMKYMHETRDINPSQRFAINLTPASLCRQDLARTLRKLLTEYDIAPQQIVLEMTETTELTNIAQAEQTVRDLQVLGFKIAIDDFGTGYASYSRLKNMHADILKIDGSFIRNIAYSKMDYKIVESIYELARMKKMKVVAEYVETEEIGEILFQMGIDYLQGYAIGRPVPINTLSAL